MSTAPSLRERRKAETWTAIHESAASLVPDRGLGLVRQILVLIVQNTFPLPEVGAATASNNFFRQIGATLGSAVVGSGLSSLLVERLPPAALEGCPAGSTP